MLWTTFPCSHLHLSNNYQQLDPSQSINQHLDQSLPIHQHQDRICTTYVDLASSRNQQLLFRTFINCTTNVTTSPTLPKPTHNTQLTTLPVLVTIKCITPPTTQFLAHTSLRNKIIHCYLNDMIREMGNILF